MSQWARNNPEAMEEIAALPLSARNEALRGAMVTGASDADPAAAFYVDKLTEARWVEALLGARVNAGEEGLLRELQEAQDRMAHWWRLARACGADVGENARGSQ